jgi:cardiolipin synthase A/B
MNMAEWITQFWAAILPAVHVAAAVSVTVDAVLRKRHVHSVIGWVGLAWLAPIVGSLLYLGFGINRIKRSASALRLQAAWDGADRRRGVRDAVCPPNLDAAHPGFAGLARLGERITGSPLLGGNRVQPLVDGEQAYPAMLAAIGTARHSIALQSYIFDNDRAGRRFLEALAAAQARGVEVRVLVDDFGSRYTLPSMVRKLRRAGIRAATFLPTWLPNWLRYANLRNHRKILVVDGVLGFTGGMNIRAAHEVASAAKDAVRCLHFEVRGPVVADLQRTFATDWAFTTGEQLQGELWFPPPEAAGTVAARGIPDGPDADIDNILHLILGALAVATRSVRIVTPYFLPDEVLLRALQVAAMRGVAVDIVLPAKSNIFLVDWASAPLLPDLLRKGCRIHLTGAPFDHTKLLVVDGFWSLIGSTNWDARSLRLNFEYNLECYDSPLARSLDALIDSKIARARQPALEELDRRPLPIRLRNGLARMLSPYL